MIGGVHISQQDVGTLGVTIACVAVLWLFFRFSKLGLAMRAGALNPDAARLLGVRTSWLLALGWGFAAVLGAVSGMMVAPSVFLTPNMMQAILIYAFAAAVLGGLESPVGAVVGGLALGVTLNLLGHVRRLRRLDAPASRRPRGAALRPAPPSRRTLRPRHGETGMKRLGGPAGFALLVALRRARTARLEPLPDVPARLRRHLPDGARRPQHADRPDRADLARARRVHGHRRLHDRDPRRRSRLARHLDDPARRAGRRRRRPRLRRSRRPDSPGPTSRSRRSRSRCRSSACSRSSSISPEARSARTCRSSTPSSG